jgi:hypothetical protein
LSSGLILLFFPMRTSAFSMPLVSPLCTVSQSVVQGLSTKQPPASERMFNRFLGPTQRVSGEGRCLRSPAAAWVILEHRKFSCRGAGV